MTKAEQTEYTKDAVKEMQEQRDAAPKKSNIAISTFHDARSTIDVVKREVSLLFTLPTSQLES